MKIEDLKKLCEEASPGPWTIANEASLDRGLFQYRDCADVHGPKGVVVSLLIEDAKFIAAARTLMPKLLAVIEAAKDCEAYYGGDEHSGAIKRLKANLEILEAGE